MLRPQPPDTFQRLGVRQQLAVRVSATAANLGHLRIGQAHVPHMLDVVEQRARRGVLLAFRQLLDLTQGLFEELCHEGSLAHRVRKITSDRTLKIKLTSGRAPCRKSIRGVQRRKGAFEMALGIRSLRPTFLAVALALLTAFSASPARADRCEDTAKELRNQIDGIKISVNTGNMIYLTHPAAKEFSLGCRGTNYSVELYAKADRKPKPQFFELVAAAGAIIFTIPKPDALTGTSRCIKRMGLLRGDKVSMRYRRLNMECTRTKTEASIVVTRGKDE